MKVSSRKSGFTLVEMLVVISILGILAALAVPAIKNLGKSNISISAARQLLDDVGAARQLAINNHTTVYMVFVPEGFWNQMSPAVQQLPDTTNLIDKQLTGYTFVSYGKVGDQPGQHQWHYLAPWKNLPEGTFIAEQKFIPPSQFFNISPFDPTIPIHGFDTNVIPFPTETNVAITLPYIAFNYLGQLTDDGVNLAGSHEYIPLARGAVLPAIDPSSRALQLGSPAVSESPAGNSTNSAYDLVDIDPLTGRATLRFQKAQ